MSADYIISAMEEAKDKIITQHARIDELLQKTQQLQRENTAMSSLLTLNSKELDQLRRKIAALREDKERLDWLEIQGEPVTYEDEPHELVWSVFGERGQHNLRDAIDAARKEAKP